MSFLADTGRILVTGATGQVGTALRSVLPGAVFLTRRDLDLADVVSIAPAIASYRPAAVINAAAYTNVDLAEREEARATLINGEAVGAMAAACADLAIPLVTYSTDYVFGGRASTPYVESDAADPVGAYGRSKLVGERLALDRHPGALIVRTSWVISATHDNFVSTMLRLAARGPVRVVNDQFGKPTIAADLAAATAEALSSGLRGIVHVANEGATTWHGLASAAVRLAGLDPSLVQPCATDEYPTEAVRPAYSVLGTEREDTPKMPMWPSSLPGLVAAQVERIGDQAGQ